MTHPDRESGAHSLTNWMKATPETESLVVALASRVGVYTAEFSALHVHARAMEARAIRAEGIMRRLIKDSEFMRAEYNDMNAAVTEAETFLGTGK